VTVVPTPASSVILLRRRACWEMLMVERPARGVFGGIWAFPGGAVEAADRDPDLVGFSDPWRSAGLRETAEEVGIFLTDPRSATPTLADDGDVFAALDRSVARFDPERLRYLASWITPEMIPRRFEARFYVAEVDADVEGAVVTEELVDMAWAEPSEILRRVADGEWSMIFPTVWHVELLADCDDPLALSPHPIRQLKTPVEPWEVIDFGLPSEETVS
jgi:8-oxo-dGTP pyrophosphatase MutT (NUDIX family)